MAKRKQPKKAEEPRPEFRPDEKQPDRIDLPCGCELAKEKMNDKTTYYYVSFFCAEHDPSLWENYAEEDNEK